MTYAHPGLNLGPNHVITLSWLTFYSALLTSSAYDDENYGSCIRVSPPGCLREEKRIRRLRSFRLSTAGGNAFSGLW